ncbi:cytochrome P450 [Desarmillaria tabescens]|uniref:Cytochrome P450 n=1 Tax=Armillaria tabescens TaxID=1929756 RepID=A0AA39MZ27_ARMTA|nr:cytochrome P450 [Desarmillaria tabescens]KAK0451384.1 cytochrome P450 [Desarmillaria tabescens]
MPFYGKACTHSVFIPSYRGQLLKSYDRRHYQLSPILMQDYARSISKTSIEAASHEQNLLALHTCHGPEFLHASYPPSKKIWWIFFHGLNKNISWENNLEQGFFLLEGAIEKIIALTPYMRCSPSRTFSSSRTTCNPITYYFVFPTAAFLLAFTLLRFKDRKSMVRRIPGPPSPSSLLGHEYLLRNRQHVGDMEMEWYQQYGAVYLTKGCFGHDVLSVADPKALQYIFHSSGYRFPKTRDMNRINAAIAGPGLVVVDVVSEMHQRQRKILNPAFATQQLRLFLTVFQASATKLTEQINQQVKDTGVINVLEWTGKAALDIIGIIISPASFRYDFNSLSGGQTELMAATNNLFGDGMMSPTSLELLCSSLWRLLPEWLVVPLEWLPNRITTWLNYFRNVAKRVSRPIYEKQLKEVANDINPAEKDVVSLLAISQLNDDAKKKMSNIEIDSQLASFVFAGHDTIAESTGWLLYELSLHPEDQARIREEISQTKSKASGALTSNDYDLMIWLNACIKVGRISREFLAGVDTWTSTLGSPPSPSSGAYLVSSIVSGLSSVWGDDANEWNPSRFLDGRDVKQTSIGVYANLLTFSAGIRGCIGWKFAVMELQSLITELLSNFEFSMPKGVSKLQHGPIGVGLIPIVPGKAEQGAQIPLLVTALNK